MLINRLIMMYILLILFNFYWL